MTRLEPVRQVAVLATAALFAALMLVASSTGHPTVHHTRATAGSVTVAHHAVAVTASSAGQDHHVDAALDLAVLGDPDLVRVPRGRDLAPADEQDDQAVAPATATDARGPPTA